MAVRRFARRGTCPLCHAEVWQDPEDFFRPVLNADPLESEAVIPALKARQSLYQKAGAIGVLFIYVEPLYLARHLKAGGVLPPDLYGLHDHQSFKPDPKPREVFPERPPF